MRWDMAIRAYEEFSGIKGSKVCRADTVVLCLAHLHLKPYQICFKGCLVSVFVLLKPEAWRALESETLMKSHY